MSIQRQYIVGQWIWGCGKQRTPPALWFMPIKMMPSNLSTLIAVNDPDFPLFVWYEYNDECEREILYIADSDNTLVLDLPPELAFELGKALTKNAEYAINRERRAHQETA